MKLIAILFLVVGQVQATECFRLKKPSQVDQFPVEVCLNSLLVKRSKKELLLVLSGNPFKGTYALDVLKEKEGKLTVSALIYKNDNFDYGCGDATYRHVFLDFVVDSKTLAVSKAKKLEGWQGFTSDFCHTEPDWQVVDYK